MVEIDREMRGQDAGFFGRRVADPDVAIVDRHVALDAHGRLPRFVVLVLARIRLKDTAELRVKRSPPFTSPTYLRIPDGDLS
ncbi:hypothetical protein TMPK1_40480 [Rhodospirillales bacterium TMPK1]|uniref:Uncharacterized protein n=1 Tax=Roseiterribacter gracilis TaxID=2812848 RepID=A0A8S8XIC7_9PROT|nr:hypothetical protein TMPK1_40480 [Rhodospirillales bacterium TMPK1]